jgi:hypothetical protein
VDLETEAYDIMKFSLAISRVKWLKARQNLLYSVAGKAAELTEACDLSENKKQG